MYMYIHVSVVGKAYMMLVSSMLHVECYMNSFSSIEDSMTVYQFCVLYSGSRSLDISCAIDQLHVRTCMRNNFNDRINYG